MIGVIAKAFFDEWGNSRKAKRDKVARNEQRLDAFRLRRSEFQRANLLELQDEFMKLLRIVGRIHSHDINEFKKCGQWQKHLLPDDLDEGFRLSNVSVSRLVSRIHNDELRKHVENVIIVSSRLSIAKSEEESARYFGEFINSSATTNQLIGNVIRKLDDDEEDALRSSVN